MEGKPKGKYPKPNRVNQTSPSNAEQNSDNKNKRTMNLIKNISILLISLSLFIACEPSVGDKSDIGSPPAASFTVSEGESPNYFVLTNTTVDDVFMIEWDSGDYGSIDGEGDVVELYIPFMGTYDANLTVFNRGGHGIATQQIVVTQDDPNACFGNYQVLTGDCTEKTWKLAPEAGALKVGPTLEAVGDWWGNSAEDVTVRDCHFNDRYTFRSDGQFEFESNGDFWADIPQVGLATDNCYASSEWPEGFETWDSGLHTYSINDETLTVIGEGAWIGLYKIGTNAEVTSPQSSVAFSIGDMTDERMTLNMDYGTGVWQITLVPAE